MNLSLHCTLQTFEQKFPTEESCLEYLRYERWGEEEFVCPRCGSLDGYKIENRAVIQCAWKRCRYQSSITAGTIFHKTKVSIRKWFLAILHLCENPMLTVRELAEIVQVSIKTAWLMLQKINHAYEEWKIYENDAKNEAKNDDAIESFASDPLECTEEFDAVNEIREMQHYINNNMNDDEMNDSNNMNGDEDVENDEVRLRLASLLSPSYASTSSPSWIISHTINQFYFYITCCVNSDHIYHRSVAASYAINYSYPYAFF